MASMCVDGDSVLQLTLRPNATRLHQHAAGSRDASGACLTQRHAAAMVVGDAGSPHLGQVLQQLRQQAAELRGGRRQRRQPARRLLLQAHLQLKKCSLTESCIGRKLH